MLLQTNSYVVPKEKRAEHARLLRRFGQALARLGCTDFEVYEQVGTNWSADQTGGRFVQIMRFRDRKHQLAVQAAEREDPVAQALVAEFCELINFPYQQENNLFAVGYYTALMGPNRHAAELEAVGEPSPVAPPEFPASEPVGEATPDLSRLAQEFVRSARPPEAQQTRPVNGQSAAFEQVAMDPEAHENSEPTQAPPAHPPEHSRNGNGKYDFHIPQYATAWDNEEDEQPPASAAANPPVNPLDEPVPSLDELLDMEIGQTAAEQDEATPVSQPEPAPESESSGIGHILSASLADDELDIALPAELVDPADLESFSHHADPHLPLHDDILDHEPRRG